LSKINIWPVIHVHNMNSALAQIDIIKSIGGCKGVFLISMRGDDNLTTKIANEIIKEQIKSNDSNRLLIGINHLSLSPDISYQQSLSLDAIWTDCDFIRSERIDHAINNSLNKLHQTHKKLLFSPVAFKYKAFEKNPIKTAIKTIEYGYIPTTSGDATGSPPSAEKLKTISDGIKNKFGVNKLAVASGISEKNIIDLHSYITDVLISSSLCNSSDEIDRVKLNNFMNLISNLT
jgi:hypothetical protein